MNHNNRISEVIKFHRLGFGDATGGLACSRLGLVGFSLAALMVDTQGAAAGTLTVQLQKHSLAPAANAVWDDFDNLVVYECVDPSASSVFTEVPASRITTDAGAGTIVVTGVAGVVAVEMPLINIDPNAGNFVAVVPTVTFDTALSTVSVDALLAAHRFASVLNVDTLV